MGNQKSITKLSKFLLYVLGRRPDEFGLIPDHDGYVKIKELIKALSEEEGWRHVRRALIDEILITSPAPPFEIKDEYIRAKNRDKLSEQTISLDLPKLYYTCITEKSYTSVLEKGIFPTRYPYVILATEREMAERIGKRRDPQPALLTVHVQQAIDSGIVFYQAGELLSISDFIPANCFTGPPLLKKKPEPKKTEKPLKKKTEPTPGSYIVNIKDDLRIPKRKKQKDKTPSWKRDKRKLRREKQKDWPE